MQVVPLKLINTFSNVTVPEAPAPEFIAVFGSDPGIQFASFADSVNSHASGAASPFTVLLTRMFALGSPKEHDETGAVTAADVVHKALSSSVIVSDRLLPMV